MSIYAGSYNGISWGSWPASPYGVAKQSGFEDLPPIRYRATPRSQLDGQAVGRYLLGQGALKLELHIRATPLKTLDQACRDLLMATPRVLDGSVPLYYDGETKMALVRLTNRTIDRDPAQTYAVANVQWDVVESTIFENPVRTIGLSPVSLTGAGIRVPVATPLAVWAPAVAANYAAANYGNKETYPVITIPGPALNMTVVNATLGGMFVRYGFALGVNDRLVIDFKTQSAILNGQSSRTETSDSQWWWLPPSAIDVIGVSQLLYRSDAPDPRSIATVQWRSAWA